MIRRTITDVRAVVVQIRADTIVLAGLVEARHSSLTVKSSERVPSSERSRAVASVVRVVGHVRALCVVFARRGRARDERFAVTTGVAGGTAADVVGVSGGVRTGSVVLAWFG